MIKMSLKHESFESRIFIDRKFRHSLMWRRCLHYAYITLLSFYTLNLVSEVVTCIDAPVRWKCVLQAVAMIDDYSINLKLLAGVRNLRAQPKGLASLSKRIQIDRSQNCRGTSGGPTVRALLFSDDAKKGN